MQWEVRGPQTVINTAFNLLSALKQPTHPQDPLQLALLPVAMIDVEHPPPTKRRFPGHQIRDSCGRGAPTELLLFHNGGSAKRASCLFTPLMGRWRRHNHRWRAAKQEGCPGLTSPETGWLWYSPSTQQTPLRLKAFYSPWPFSTHLSWEKSSLLLPASPWQAIPSKTKGQVVQWHKANMGDLSAFERVTL